jgi:hypothetical protein
MKVLRRKRIAAICLLALALEVPAQEVVDRIAARVDTDIILLSEVRTLARWQSFMDDRKQSDLEILNLLIDQWIVRHEAKAALYPQPSDEDVQKSLGQLKRSFSSPEEFAERENQAGLTDEAVSRMLKSQVYLTNYLDSRFRASIQVEDKDVEEYYKTRLVPRAEARGQSPPTL